MTNLEKIKTDIQNMSAEEFAKYMFANPCEEIKCSWEIKCSDCIKKWLESEVKE